MAGNSPMMNPEDAPEYLKIGNPAFVKWQRKVKRGCEN